MNSIGKISVLLTGYRHAPKAFYPILVLLPQGNMSNAPRRCLPVANGRGNLWAAGLRRPGIAATALGLRAAG